MVLSDKSIGYYISVISVLLTGNTWIQISPNIPDERIIQISKISGAKIIIYDDSFKRKLNKKFKNQKIYLLNKILVKNTKSINSKIQLPKIKKTDNAMIFFTSAQQGCQRGPNNS